MTKNSEICRIDESCIIYKFCFNFYQKKKKTCLIRCSKSIMEEKNIVDMVI